MFNLFKMTVFALINLYAKWTLQFPPTNFNHEIKIKNCTKLCIVINMLYM